MIVALASGCSADAAPASSAPPSADAGGDATPAPVTGPRELDATVTFDANGISTPVDFIVPDGTRSITVVVEGETTRLYGLASFVLGDGSDRVGIDLATSHATAMKESYFDEQVGRMPGSLDQSVRLGTFTHVYPYAPAQSLVAGRATLRIASDAADGTARVKVLLPADDGARVLHLNVARVSTSATMSAPPPFLDELRAIFAQADIDVIIDEVVTLSGTPYAKLTTFTEPQEAPDSDAAKLASISGPKTSSAALDVMIVDDLPAGVAGLSLGVPGPPMAGSYYFGVVIEDADATSLGRVVAHEVAHFLGLQHVTNRGISGAVYADPLDDTSPTSPNLMTKGTELTPGQVFVLQRSALLTAK